ncbi:MAG: SpoIIE family protein phosphatase [Clostridia bacterium]|nr:SpoIIE family protein phosphatase [Clostridia bacterium]
MNSKPIIHLLRAFVAALLMTLMVFSGALKRVDKWAQDGLFQREKVTNTDIVIIGIDDATLETLGPYPTNYRDFVAFALEELAADPSKKPLVTAVDVLYEGYSDEVSDAHLADAAAKLGNVITATMAEYGESITWEQGHAKSIDANAVTGYVQPYDALRERSGQGHINAMYDKDGVMRHAILYIDLDEKTRVYSMAWEAAKVYAASRGMTLEVPATGPTGQYYIPYSAKPGGYYDGANLAQLIFGEVPADFWAGKIVLIGPYASGLQDSYYTPISTAEQMFGVEIQANIIQSLLEANTKMEVGDCPQLLALFLLCFAAISLYQKLGLNWGGAVCAGFIALGLGGSLLLYKLGYVTHPLWLAVSAALLYDAALVFKYIRAAKERRALALEKERISAELSLAARIQESALIKDFPPFPERREFDIFASMDPAKEVGGDFYDFFMSDDDHLVLLIGDVSGKGVPASLFMMVAMTLLRHVAMNETSPASIMQTVNREICARNPEEMFITAWLGILEISTGKLKCVNAGHEYPVLQYPGEGFALFKDKHGFVLGGMDGVRYKEYELELKPGTKLFVYTDGVPEATNAGEQLFGAERMVEALNAVQHGEPKQILSGVKSAVDRFVGTAPQFDDLTMLCLRYNGPMEEND